MITLIGTRWKRSNALSRGVLMSPFPLGDSHPNCPTFPNYHIQYSVQFLNHLLANDRTTKIAMQFWFSRRFCSGDSVRWSHLFPFRTESLSAATSMVLRKRESRCRQNRPFEQKPSREAGFLHGTQESYKEKSLGICTIPRDVII
jgi:hypothetical protein